MPESVLHPALALIATLALLVSLSLASRGVNVGTEEQLEVPPRFAVLLEKYRPFVPVIYPSDVHSLLYSSSDNASSYVNSHRRTHKEFPVVSPSPIPRHRKLWLLDVREVGEFTLERIPGAVWTGRGNLEWNIERKGIDAEMGSQSFGMPTRDLIIVYCGGGFRAILAGYNRVQMGYTQVRSIDGGIHAWKAERFPTESC
ncbi:Rhodanese-like protein [Gonapodya prolifera JEL478]|uniref:Rhodanese-like protein n=1 Tax=Gonapodya prolifera (strain JEL478) TaxID=1344416 RepID=A0A138ZZB4_GONPJ|nr:Rhodanese-like protein [Gonapodya prolifera JEL478]|eukprot:KXS09831.1 Rhodanese-like protein [Gonapodya prolifera JEL478]